jgi:hypothetical protein
MRTSFVSSYRSPQGRFYLQVIAKRGYVFRHGGRAEPVSDPALIHAIPEFAPALGDQDGRLLHETELLAGLKPATDVLLHGSARSHRGPVPALTAALRVGPAAKSVQVWGDRRVELGRGGALAFSPPEPFTVMPVTWERAYGGRDVHAESKEAKVPDLGPWPADVPEPTLGALSYPRNPHGRGFFLDVDLERLAGAPVPNLDDAADPVRPDRMVVRDYLDWIDCPVATSFEPIDAFTFPRALFFLPTAFNKPLRPIHELTTGTLGRDDLARMEAYDPTPHPRALNCAPAGLATHRLYGGERVQLWNLHAERELFELDLPGDRPRFSVEPPGVAPREAEPMLQTVIIEPERSRVTLTWAGTIEVAALYPPEMTDGMRHSVAWSR